jgi:hypothetical protein
MSDIYSSILIRELGKLGGFGARIAARFLPTVPYQVDIELSASLAEAQQAAASVLQKAGRTDSELPDYSIIMGSGHANLNPTIVTLSFAPSDSGTRISIRAVAKEGLVKQHAAQKSVERVVTMLQEATGH